MSDTESYRRFIDWLGRTWWELPESEYLEPLIQSNFTPREATTLTDMPFSPKSVQELAAMKGMDPADLAPSLKEMARKGMVYESWDGDSARYRLNDSFMALLRANLWPGRTDERARSSSRLINKYFLNGWFDQYADVRAKGLRTLPINKTVDNTKQFLPFEDVVKVIEDRQYYTVSICPCRHRHNLDPDMPDCKHPTEVCLHFDELGRYIVENGLGREITKEETYKILKKAADSGLVHGLSNWEEKPDTLCNCCSCCCMWFESHHKLGFDTSMDSSNYTVSVKPDTCKGCALCVKRCPMDAIQLKVSVNARNKIGKVATVDPDSCIGCGVCAHKCPSKSLALVRKDETTKPPQSIYEYAARFLADREAGREKRGAKG